MTCGLVVSPTWIVAIVSSLAKFGFPMDTQPESTNDDSTHQELRNMLNSMRPLFEEGGHARQCHSDREKRLPKTRSQENRDDPHYLA
jgi:hypothetical protein